MTTLSMGKITAGSAVCSFTLTVHQNNEIHCQNLDEIWTCTVYYFQYFLKVRDRLFNNCIRKRKKMGSVRHERPTQEDNAMTTMTDSNRERLAAITSGA